MKRFVVFVSLIASMLVSAAARGQTPMGTAFTYQGQIEDASGPITDNCDFEFSLWDAEFEGNEQGDSPQLVEGVSVEDGLFTVAIDFGAGAMNGEARWLELAVCCPSPCTVETLDPRQELTPAPQAIRALEGIGPPEAVNLDASGNVGIGTAAPARALHIQGNNGTIRVDRDTNSPGIMFVRTASGDFDTVWKTFGISVIGDAPGSGKLAINDKGTAVSGGGVRRFTIDTDGNVGIGTETPSELLDVAGNIHASGAVSSGSSITIDGTGDTIIASSGTISFDDEDLVTTGVIESTTGGFKLPDGTILDDASDLGGASPWTSSGSDILYTSGSVGIGTTGPFFPGDDTIATMTATLPSGRFGSACAADPASGKIYCFGGDDGPLLDEIVEYDPVADSLTTMTATLPSARLGLACAGEPESGKIYCFGGDSSTGYLDEIVEYDPVTDSVTTMTATLPSARRHLACAGGTLRGVIYCLGGRSATGYLDEIVKYNVVTDTLTTRAATLPSTRSGLTCAVSMGSIFCLGGYDPGCSCERDDIYLYNQITDSVTTMTATLPSGRAGFACVADAVSGKIYCFGGYDGTGELDEIVEYDLFTDSLTTIAATLPSVRAYLACAADSASRNIYCYGGALTLPPYVTDEIVAYSPPAHSLLQVGEPGDGTGAIANTWSVFSSRTFKRDITPLEASDYQDILAKLNATAAVRYSYNHDAQQTEHLGVIAEDSPAEILTPGGKAISLGDFTTFLMAAIKAQQAEIEAQQAEIAALNSRLGTLESAGSHARADVEGGAR